MVNETEFPTGDEHVYPGEQGTEHIDQQGAEKETMGAETSETSPVLPVSEDTDDSSRSQVARQQRTVTRPVWQEYFM